MVAPASAFCCERCGRPLRAARVRQGVLVHPECRAAPGPAPDDAGLPPSAAADATAALARAQELVARVPAGVRDPELRELFAQAAAQARALVSDLEELARRRAAGQR